MTNGKLSQGMLVCVLLVLISTVDADINSDHSKCINSQASANEITRCRNAFPGPQPAVGPIQFISDPEISNYCRNYKYQYIQWATCLNSVTVNCYKPEHQDLTMANSGLRSSIEYFCQRLIDGLIFNLTCGGIESNPELIECFRQLDDITTPSGNNITYEGLKYNNCRSGLIWVNCIRDDVKMKTVCPDTQTTYSTVLEKQLPPACVASSNTGIWSLILMTFLISLFNN